MSEIERGDWVRFKDSSGTTHIGVVDNSENGLVFVDWFDGPPSWIVTEALERLEDKS